MILVVGATGYVGGEICRLLAGRGLPVRALTRTSSHPGRVERLRALPAEIVSGDLKDRGSLDAACSGVSVVISTASITISRQDDDSISGVDRDGQIALVEAARAAGVEQFIFISISGNLELDCPLHTAKRAVERHLQQSGLTYTILRPSFFMEVWLSPALGFDPAKGVAQIYGSGERPISWISFSDVARFAVACVGNPSARNAVLELGGPEMLSPQAVVRTFEEITGRRFDVKYVPEEALEQQWRAAGDPLQKTFAALMLDFARGDPIDMSRTLDSFPMQLTSVRDYASRTAAS